MFKSHDRKAAQTAHQLSPIPPQRPKMAPNARRALSAKHHGTFSTFPPGVAPFQPHQPHQPPAWTGIYPNSRPPPLSRTSICACDTQDALSAQRRRLGVPRPQARTDTYTDQTDPHPPRPLPRGDVLKSAVVPPSSRGIMPRGAPSPPSKRSSHECACYVD